MIALLVGLTLAIAVSAQDDPELEARTMAIAKELRCVVCQNQSVADSEAALAGDLRQQIRDQLRAGRSAEEIRAYMTERYGDFVLYSPPLNARTALLWFGPALLLAVGGVALVVVLRRRARLADDAFEPDGTPPAS